MREGGREGGEGGREGGREGETGGEGEGMRRGNNKIDTSEKRGKVTLSGFMYLCTGIQPCWNEQ